MNALKSIVVGFIAGAIAAVTVQELVSWLFLHYWTGWNEIPWSTEPVPSLVYPDIVMPWIASTALTGGRSAGDWFSRDASIGSRCRSTTWPRRRSVQMRPQAVVKAQQ